MQNQSLLYEGILNINISELPLGTPVSGEHQKPSKVLKDGVNETRQAVKPRNVNYPLGIQKYSHHTA